MSVVSTSGIFYFSELRNVFGGTGTIYSSDYYGNSGKEFTKDVLGIPNTGSLLNFGTFRGKSKPSGMSASAGTISVSPAVNGKTSWSPLSDGIMTAFTPGTEYTFTVGNTMTCRVDMWGAGGGFGTYGGGYKGGNGGYTYGTVTLNPGIIFIAMKTMVSQSSYTWKWRRSIASRLLNSKVVQGHLSMMCNTNFMHHRGVLI